MLSLSPSLCLDLCLSFLFALSYFSMIALIINYASCSSSANNGGCEQTCTNKAGSLTCSCGSGYVLSANGKSCADINECAEGISGCSQLCNNTRGSFVCACMAGYTLSGKACIAQPCPNLVPPTNGFVFPNVSGVTGDVRSFSCGANFGLVGHVTATCNAPSWSASAPTCVSAGGTQSNPGTSCAALKTAGSTTNGLYWVNPTNPVQVYCDMEFGFTVSISTQKIFVFSCLLSA